jgi:hypothetical protein
MKLADNRFWQFEALMPLCGFMLLCEMVVVLVCNGAEFENGALLLLLLPLSCFYFVISGIPAWLLYKGNSWLRLAGYLYLVSALLLIVPLWIFLYNWNLPPENLRSEHTDNDLVIALCAEWAVLLVLPVLITSFLTKKIMDCEKDA